MTWRFRIVFTRRALWVAVALLCWIGSSGLWIRSCSGGNDVVKVERVSWSSLNRYRSELKVAGLLAASSDGRVSLDIYCRASMRRNLLSADSAGDRWDFFVSDSPGFLLRRAERATLVGFAIGYDESPFGTSHGVSFWLPHWLLALPAAMAVLYLCWLHRRRRHARSVFPLVSSRQLKGDIRAIHN